jgi:hypothetical protein
MSNEYATLASFGVNSNGNVVNRGGTIAGAIAAMVNTATPVDSGTTDVQGVAAATGLRLTGFSVGETAGATAVVTLRNGDANGDPAVAHISLAANGAQIVIFPDGGIPCPDGVWVDRESGTTELVLYTKTISLAS